MNGRKGRTYGDHVGSNVTDTTSPTLRRVIEDIVNADTLVFGGEGIEVLLEEDILRSDVGKDEIDLGLVTLGTATNNGADDLQHGGDASATSNHTKVTDHVGGVDESSLGTTDADALANHQGSHVLGDVALGVRLDEQVKVTRLVVARDGGVGANNLLGLAVGLLERSANGDVLADGEAEDGRRRGELEAVAAQCQRCYTFLGGRLLVFSDVNLHGDIVGDDRLLLKLKLLEEIRLEDLLKFCKELVM